ncbi:hypothetical protein ACLB2K_007803 [Fragaria x ananassa]
MSCDSISDDGYSPSSDRPSLDSSSDNIKKMSDDRLGPSSDDVYGIVPLLKKPEPVPENSSDEKWKWFKNCLEALDETYIRVHVPESDKPRYRSGKNEIATNVLGVCSQDIQFIYVLPVWEGSAADSRVLRDAISRRHGLRVPHGYYYLVNAGYPNEKGFLSPYRGQRYHLNDWRDGLVKAFRKDRANELGAEGPVEVVEDLNNNNEFVDLKGDGLCENIVPTSATRTPSAPSSTRTRK